MSTPSGARISRAKNKEMNEKIEDRIKNHPEARDVYDRRCPHGGHEPVDGSADFRVELSLSRGSSCRSI